MAKSSIVIPQKLLNLDKSVMKAVEKGIDDCTDDLLRVASLRSPVDEGNLEKNGTSKVYSSGSKVIGKVGFSAMNKGYNYALKMDRGNYKLGAKSKLKSKRGIRSKFTKEVMTVGSGYLSDTAKKCTDGYTDHVNRKIYESITKDGFNVVKK